MLIQVLVFALLVRFVAPYRISPSENRILKRTCSNRWNTYKSLGGRTIFLNEFPFMASILFEDRYGVEFCSGVLISPRHVLTAGHCVIDFDEDHYYKVCQYANEYRAYRLRNPFHFSIYLGSRYRAPLRNPSVYKAAKIHLHEYWGKCDNSNDLAIIELEYDADPREAFPICMPDRNTDLAVNLRSAGIGLDPTKNGDVLDNVLQVIEVYRFAPQPPTPGVISTYSRTASMCPGDSGGPLFQSNTAGKHMLVGIGSTTTDCYENLPERHSSYVDVRKQLDWVCRITGVCALN